MANEIGRTNSQTKILAASFKNVVQVNTALEYGAQAVTMGVDIVAAAFTMSSVEKAIDDFTNDGNSGYGKGQTITDL